MSVLSDYPLPPQPEYFKGEEWKKRRENEEREKKKAEGGKKNCKE